MKTLLISLASLAVATTVMASTTPEAIDLPKKLSKKLKSFEPSGAVYIESLGKYLVVSDDTDKADSPWLFAMGDDGVVEKDAVEISGMGAMTDMESISLGGDGYLYVMSSQGLNKKGKLKPERNQFVRASVSSTGVEMVDSIELRPILLAALSRAADPRLKSVSSKLGDEINIESHFIVNGEIFIGLKGPQPRPGQALIVGLGGVDALFTAKTIGASSLRVAHAIDFKAISGEDDLLADIVAKGDALFMATTNAVKNGRVWSFNTKTDELKVIQEFKGGKCEGIAFGPNGDLLVVFDEDEGGAMFAHVQSNPIL